MRLKYAFAALLLLIVSGSSFNTAQDVPEPKAGLDVFETHLDNGLQVLVVSRPGVPLVSSYVWYHVGSMDETPGNTGMAHYLEHMMFKGSSKYKVGEVDSVTVCNGGSNNAFTSNDFTAYFIDLPKSRFHEALKIEADRMRQLTLDQDEFDAEKKVVQSESDISADNPSSRLWERMDGRLFGPGHPYSHPVLGWPQDVQDVTRRDMRQFYDKHYHPNHATLILVGDLTAQEGLAAAKQHFGAIPRGPDINRPQPRAIDFKGPAVIEQQSDSPVIEFGRQYLGATKTHKDTPTLDVMAMILGSGVTSRLYREVVEEQRVATAIAAGNNDQMLAGSVWIWAQLAPGRERHELEAAIEASIRRLIDEGVTDDELRRTKNRFISSLVFQTESASSLAQALGEAQVTSGNWRRVLEYPDMIRAVTARDVRRAAATYLYPENAVTGWLVPELSPDQAGDGLTDAAPGALDVKRHVLANGLTVLMLERRGLPIVSVSASVRAGRAGERANEGGLSNLTGALLDVGTRDFSKQQIAEMMQDIGAQLRVGADGASLRMLSEHTEIGLNVLEQCLVHPTFPEAEVELAKQQVLAGIESSSNETSWFARNAASAALYGPDSVFGRPAEGSKTSVAAFKREQLADWHKRFFRPDNCVIALVGDFDSDDMLKRVQAQFSDWKRPADKLTHAELDFKRPAKLEGEQVFNFSSFDPAQVEPTRKRIMIDHPQKDQVIVRLQTLGIKRNNPDYYTLLVMDNILGTSPGFTDRFSGKLRDEMGLAYSTYANISGGSSHYQGSFLGYIGTRPENVELALKTMYELIEEIRTEPVTDEELASAKDYLKGSFVFDIETTGQLAGLLVNIERFGLGFDYLVKYAEAVDAVTAADITRVAQKYLVPEQMVEVIAGPVTKITPIAPEEPEQE